MLPTLTGTGRCEIFVILEREHEMMKNAPILVLSLLMVVLFNGGKLFGRSRFG